MCVYLGVYVFVCVSLCVCVCACVWVWVCVYVCLSLTQLPHILVLMFSDDDMYALFMCEDGGQTCGVVGAGPELGNWEQTKGPQPLFTDGGKEFKLFTKLNPFFPSQ